jgi:hypothetical protein
MNLRSISVNSVSFRMYLNQLEIMRALIEMAEGISRDTVGRLTLAVLRSEALGDDPQADVEKLWGDVSRLVNPGDCAGHD